MWGPTNPHPNANFNTNINASNALEELKAHAVKAKSFKPKIKDLQLFAAVFEKYFASNKYNFTALDKVIEYFLQIYHSILHLTAHTDRMAECFRKLIHWANGSTNTELKPAYCLIKATVQFCQKEFKDQLLRSSKEQNKSEKVRSNSREPSKSRDQSREKSREPSAENDRKDRARQEKQTNPENLRSNLKAMLSLVRKAGDKNMLNENVYEKFVDYYLQRIQKSVEQTQQRISKSPQENWHILSALSTFLAVRNKTQVSPMASYHLNRSQANPNSPSGYIGVYLLMELPNIEDLLANALIQYSTVNGGIGWNFKIVQLFNQSIQNKSTQGGRLSDIIQLIVSKLVLLFKQCHATRNYGLLNHLYKLYPSTIALQNSQQLLDRLIIHLFLDRLQLKINHLGPNLGLMLIGKAAQPMPEISTMQQVNQQVKTFTDMFMKEHYEYIESTSLRVSNGRNKSKNILKVQFVVKNFIVGLALVVSDKISPLMNKQKIFIIHAKTGMNKIVKALQKQNKVSSMNSQHLQNWSSYCSRLYLLADDCIMAVKPILRRNNNTNSQISPHFQQLQIDGLARYQKLLHEWKQHIKSIHFGDSHGSMREEKQEKLITSLKQKLGKTDSGELFLSWKIAMQAMFEINKDQQQVNNSLQQKWEQLYSKQALTILSAMSITPSALPKTSVESASYLILTSDSLTSLTLLEQISRIGPKQELLSHIKKLMQENFDRVDQQIIRDIIVKNIFYTKCLLMTGHPPKCKFLMELVTREIEGIGKPKQQKNSPQTKRYLKQLLPAVPEPLLVDYCKYIANRDKLQFRMALFQKEQLDSQFLVEAALFDVVLKNASKGQANDSL